VARYSVSIPNFLSVPVNFQEPKHLNLKVKDIFQYMYNHQYIYEILGFSLIASSFPMTFD